jgi:cytochrome c oxidase subunit 3
VIQASTKDKTRGGEDTLFLPPAERPPGNGGGDRPADPGPASGGEPILGNAQLAMLVVIVAELMFFAGIVGAFIVFRFSGEAWPPPFQPRLPVAITAVNTLFLLASSYTFNQAQKGLRQGDTAKLFAYLSVTCGLGALFLTIQGYEWIQLLSFGFRLSSGIYASTFYTIIGAHALHVFFAVIWLLTVLVRARLGHFSPERQDGVTACGMYWHLVVGLWPVLFFLVYLM